jgi:hypothetical protein
MALGMRDKVLGVVMVVSSGIVREWLGWRCECMM